MIHARSAQPWSRVRLLAAEHGPLSFQLGPTRKTVRSGPNERIGYGSTGFSLEIEDKIIVNLGDTLKLLVQQSPDSI